MAVPPPAAGAGQPGCRASCGRGVHRAARGGASVRSAAGSSPLTHPGAVEKGTGSVRPPPPTHTQSSFLRQIKGRRVVCLCVGGGLGLCVRGRRAQCQGGIVLPTSIGRGAARGAVPGVPPGISILLPTPRSHPPPAPSLSSRPRSVSAGGSRRESPLSCLVLPVLLKGR